MTEPPLATPDEIAEFFRTTTKQLAQDRYHGSGPKYVKLGNRIRYRWSDVYAYADANTMQRTDDTPGAA